MSSKTEKDLYTLIGRYETFSSQVLNELSTVRKSLQAGESRMTAIENTLANRGVCLLHQTIETRLKEKDEKDAEHDEKIGKVQTAITVVEYKLSTKDMAKVSIIAAGIAAPFIELVKWFLTRNL